MQRVLPSPEWFVGLIEGEGTFSNNVHHGTSVPMFSVSQKEREVCDMLKRFFGFGTVQLTHGGATYEYKTSHYENCRRIALFLQDRLVLNKRFEQFAAWCERFSLLDDSLYYSNGRRRHGSADLSMSPVQKYMLEHPKEVSRIATSLGREV